jgi:hypothetical protein
MFIDELVQHRRRMRSRGVAWAKLRIFGRLPPLMGRKKRDSRSLGGQQPPKAKEESERPPPSIAGTDEATEALHPAHF